MVALARFAIWIGCIILLVEVMDGVSLPVACALLAIVWGASTLYEKRDVEFTGFSGQRLASGFLRRSDAEVQAPDPRESPLGLRIHEGPSRRVQRTDDVPRSRSGPE